MKKVILFVCVLCLCVGVSGDTIQLSQGKVNVMLNLEFASFQECLTLLEALEANPNVTIDGVVLQRESVEESTMQYQRPVFY